MRAQKRTDAEKLAWLQFTKQAQKEEQLNFKYDGFFLDQEEEEDLSYEIDHNVEERRLIALNIPAITMMLLDEESTSLAELADFIGKQIYLQVESTYSQEQYDVILM